MHFDIYEGTTRVLNSWTHFHVEVLKIINIKIKPSLKVELPFFFSRTSQGHNALARTRTQVIWLGALCTDHWTTEQSRGDGMPMVQLITHVKSSTLYGCMVVQSYIQIFSAWWVTTILYYYGAVLSELHYNSVILESGTSVYKWDINNHNFILTCIHAHRTFHVHEIIIRCESSL